MKALKKLLIYFILLLPTLVFASATATSHLSTPVLHEVAIDAMPVAQQARKSLKIRLLERMVEKRIEKIQKKATKKSKSDKPTDKSSIASASLGLASWLILAISSSGFLLLALSVAAVVFGIIGIKAAGPNKELGGEGWAIAGLSIGITNILFVFLVLMLILAAFA